MPYPTTTPDHETGTDGWNEAERAESPLRRADRNFVELLQELRVVLTGVQILFGFLLTASFTERFTELDPVQRGLFVTTLLSAALSSVLLVAPVAAHRRVFRMGLKPELVRWAHHLTQVGLVALALTLVSGLVLVLDLAVGRIGALAGGTGLAAVVVGLWVVSPARRAR
ncbi:MULTISPECIES: DUF6328 family protein [unclassified Pseudonocardia]|uniref:DUF6328 family protein n=1 Tax=unclassified Pseudonocardia TaxID=2619320 RepID=UPI0001FFE7BD|nr:DUF6328 family protein [Pseudonocardia sp. Ae707_Ps1]OLM17605.1 hypothetical protein Ae707Ps1_1864c [Pseudonocardia sp. Ae707_Ps1]